MGLAPGKSLLLHRDLSPVKHEVLPLILMEHEVLPLRLMVLLIGRVHEVVDGLLDSTVLSFVHDLLVLRSVHLIGSIRIHIQVQLSHRNDELVQRLGMLHYGGAGRLIAV